MSPRWGAPPRLIHSRQLRLEQLERRSLLAGFLFTVNTLLDVVDAGDSLMSLREALTEANDFAGTDDTVAFQAGLTGTIALETTELTISDGVTIRGPGANRLTVSADGSFGVIDIVSASTVSFSGFTITGGGSVESGGGINTVPGTIVTLDQMVITGNTAVLGGGISGRDYRLTILNSTIANNVGTRGAGISFSTEGTPVPAHPTLRIINSTISGNESNTSAGGIEVGLAAVEIRNSTITGNVIDRRDAGGTFSGGGIHTDKPYTIIHLYNTIVAGNVRGVNAPTPDDISVPSLGAKSSCNLIGDTATAGGLVDEGNDNLVGNNGTGTIDIHSVLDTVLKLNGGGTPNHALLSGSPAINRGRNGLALDPDRYRLVADQRGTKYSRIRALTVDIGAFESDAAPLLGGFSGSVTYTENALPLLVAASATVADADSPDFATGQIVARLTANAQAADRLAIRTVGNVSTSGNYQVLFAGTLIGTFTGGGGAAALRITFNAQTNANRVQAVLRSISFEHPLENPSANPRTLEVYVTDGDGGISATVTKTINVVRVNDAPVLAPANGGAVGFQQNSAAVQLLGNALVSDPDSANFAGGILIVRAISGGNANNRLLIFNGFAFDGLNVKRVSDGLVIGTRNTNGGVGTTRLEITFNASATPGLVQHVVRGIYFRTAGGNSTARRVIEFSLTDGDGGASNKVNKTVNVTN